MEDYMRGILCGYLYVQRGVKDDAKKQRMFLVLSDSRLDYYDTDPRPAFEQDIAVAYIFTPATRVHYYVEINPKAPAHSLCLMTDKVAHVFTAETVDEATIWYKHLHERLEALASMVTGTLMLRKEISVQQQFKRMLLKTKYKWKRRYIELGRSSLRFCKESDKKTRMMKQFMFTAQSFVSEESVEFLVQHRVLASYATAIQPDAKMLSRFKKEMRELHYASDGNGNSTQTATPIAHKSRVAAAFPFVVATGQAHLFLAASSKSARTDWITAIRMRIISLKYRHNGDKNSASDSTNMQLRGFMDVQLKPGMAWKQHFVELDNNILRVKGSERKIGAKFETPLLPTCIAAPTLLKANAFVVRNLRQEVALAPSSSREAERWMTSLLRAGKAMSLTKYQKIFEDDIRALLRHSVVYTLVVPAGEAAGLVVERHKKRIVVLSHEPPATATAASATSTTSGKAVGDRDSKRRLFARAMSGSSAQQQIIPRGSALVAISQFEMAHESFETIWHHLRHKKGYQHPMTLTFRVAAMKQGVAGVRFRTRDPWALCRCTLQGGKLSIASLTPGGSGTSDRSSSTYSGRILADLPLRYCLVELTSDDDCLNGIKITLSGSSTSALATTVLMNVAAESDAFHWFALLHLESAIAQDDFRYPLSVATLAHGKKPLKRSVDVADDQRRCFRTCSVVGMRVDEIERIALETDPLLCLRSRGDQAGLIGGSSTQRSGVGHESVDIVISGCASAGSRQLSKSDSTAFFQHLDAIGCGKISPAALVRALEALTRHVERPELSLPTSADAASASDAIPTPADAPEQVTVKQQQQNTDCSERLCCGGVLSAFYAALDELVKDKTRSSSDSGGGSGGSISLTEFLALMTSVTDTEVVDLVQKMVRHDIQCM